MPKRSLPHDPRCSRTSSAPVAPKATRRRTDRLLELYRYVHTAQEKAAAQQLSASLLGKSSIKTSTDLVAERSSTGMVCASTTLLTEHCFPNLEAPQRASWLHIHSIDDLVV